MTILRYLSTVGKQIYEWRWIFGADAGFRICEYWDFYTTVYLALMGCISDQTRIFTRYTTIREFGNWQPYGEESEDGKELCKFRVLDSPCSTEACSVRHIGHRRARKEGSHFTYRIKRTWATWGPPGNLLGPARPLQLIKGMRPVRRICCGPSVPSCGPRRKKEKEKGKKLGA